jgi:hypothetical protein
MNGTQLRQCRQEFMRRYAPDEPYSVHGDPRHYEIAYPTRKVFDLTVDDFVCFCKDILKLTRVDTIRLYSYLRNHGDIIEVNGDIRFGDWCARAAKERTCHHRAVGNIPVMTGGHSGIRNYLFSLA